MRKKRPLVKRSPRVHRSKRAIRTSRRPKFLPSARLKMKRSKPQKTTAIRLRRTRHIKSREHPPDYAAGVSDGSAWRINSSKDASPEQLRADIHQQWSRRYRETSRNRKSEWRLVQQQGRNYAAGFMQGAGVHTSATAVPLQNKAAVVLCAGSGSPALIDVLSQLETLPLHEIVLVMCNPTDAIFAHARSRKNTVIAYLPDEVDYDVGRALGAKLTDAETILFVDGAQAVDAGILARFLWECEGRMDIALNDLSPHMGMFHQRSGVERIHEFLNMTLKREDLKINSLSALPFAVSRRTLDTLGAAVLAVPAKAHALAILNGLRVGVAGSASSRVFDHTHSVDSLKKAAGDHAEAWKEAMSARGSRLQFADSFRNRSVLGDWE